MTYMIAAIDDHEVTLTGLEHALAATDTCLLAGAYPNVDALLAASSTTGSHPIDVVLLDLRLADGSDPFANVEKLRDAGFRVLIYSSLESPYLARRALRAGVQGVVQKSAPTSTLHEAIEIALSGNTVANADWASYIDSDPHHKSMDLPPRLQQVLVLYASGESGKRVASLTGLSIATVQDYVNRIRDKYTLAGRSADTKIDLFKRAQEDGYLPGPFDA